MPWATRKRKLRSDDEDEDEPVARRTRTATSTITITTKKKENASSKKSKGKARTMVRATTPTPTSKQRPRLSIVATVTPARFSARLRSKKAAQPGGENTSSGGASGSQTQNESIEVNNTDATREIVPNHDAGQSAKPVEVMEVDEPKPSTLATDPSSSSALVDAPPSTDEVTVTATRETLVQELTVIETPTISEPRFVPPPPPATAYPPPPPPKAYDKPLPPPSSIPVPPKPPSIPIDASAPRMRARFTPIWQLACQMRMQRVNIMYPIDVMQGLAREQADRYYARLGLKPVHYWKIHDVGKGKLVKVAEAGKRFAAFAIDPTQEPPEEDEYDFMNEEIYDFELDSEDGEGEEVSDEDEDDSEESGGEGNGTFEFPSTSERGASTSAFEGLLDFTAGGSPGSVPPPVCAMENSFELTHFSSEVQQQGHTMIQHGGGSILPITPPRLSCIRVEGFAGMISDFSSPDEQPLLEEFNQQPFVETIGNNGESQHFSVQEMMRRAEEARMMTGAPSPSADSSYSLFMTANPHAIYTPVASVAVSPTISQRKRMAPRPRVRGTQISPERAALWYCAPGTIIAGIPAVLGGSLVGNAVAQLCGYTRAPTPPPPSFPVDLNQEQWEALMMSIPNPASPAPSMGGYESDGSSVYEDMPATPPPPPPASVPQEQIYAPYDPFQHQSQEMQTNPFWNLNQPEWMVNAVAKGYESTSLLGCEMVYPSGAGGWGAAMDDGNVNVKKSEEEGSDCE